MLTSDLSYIASILFAKVNFTHVGARKKLRDSAESTHTWLNFPLIFALLIALKNLTQACLALAWWKGTFKKNFYSNVVKQN